MEIIMNEHQLDDKLKKNLIERVDQSRGSLMFEGKNIHSSPVDGKLLCSYSEKVCMQRRLNGFAFCIRHILEDKGAPFKQCQFFAKYNKSRCINPVPILEERDYCNSHMQVLGIIPKKLKKKKDGNEKPISNHSQEAFAPTTNNLSQKHHIEGRLLAHAKNHGYSKKQAFAANCKAKHKEVDSSHRKSRNLASRDMPPLRWTSPSHLWKKLVKRKGTGKSEHEERMYDPAVRQFENQLKRSEFEKRDLFRIYMFERVEEDVTEFEETPVQSTMAEDNLVFRSDSPEEDFNRKLKHQRSQLKQSIKTRLEDRSLTYSVLQSLINAARTNAVQTANVLNSRGESKVFRGKRPSKHHPRCAASLMQNARCSKATVPYSRYCIKHISNDEDQVLYGACTARFAAGSHCGLPVVDVINERPLCSEHALKKMNSASKEASVPAKRLKRPDKIEKNRGKVPPARKNLKAHLQKKFAIPTKPTKKSNSHIGNTILDEDKHSSDRKNNAKILSKTLHNKKWMLEDADNDSEKSERDIVLPRPYEDTPDDMSPDAGDLTFGINTGSLSSPSLMSEEDDHYPLMNIGRRHHDSFTFDDDEDLLQSNAFAMNRISDHRDIRDITSPPLSQFSAESMPNTLSLAELCSPAKLTLDKPMFGSSSGLKEEVATSGFKSSLNQDYQNPVTATRDFSTSAAIGSVRSDGRLTTQSSMLPGDQYSINDANSVHSTCSATLSTSLNTLPSTSSTWATKFTLPTRNDQLPITSVGFIRVDASTHSSIYSPPFTSPSLTYRSKADYFKFENNAKQLESEGAVPARVLPSYATAVRGLDRKFDVEPPLQKVNPDIFLSTMYTVSESSNT